VAKELENDSNILCNLYSMEKNEIRERIEENIRAMFRKTLAAATNEQIYQALAFLVRDAIIDKWIATHNCYRDRDVKIVYYLSMEFLMGRFFGNTIMNLKVFDKIRDVLDDIGVDYNLLENAERDPGLGNGGLGRLAACFLDSLSTMGYPAYGCGIRYHYGIFEQDIIDGYQVERPDNWLENGDVWGLKRAEYTVEVRFFGRVNPIKQPDGKYKFEHVDCQRVKAVPYDYPVLGYGNNTVNTLRLWDAQALNAFDLQSFNKGDFDRSSQEQNLARTLTDVLYPADDFVAGKELRLKQQYFFISATLQRIFIRFKEMHEDFSLLPDKVQIQMNDTHPSMAVAEMMRLMLDEYGLEWNDAWDITRKVCSYTNHTIMAEALEKWPIEIFSRLLPRIYMIVEEINRRFCGLLVMRYGDDPDMFHTTAVIADGQVRMAYLAIVGSHSVNGVAAIHTEILKSQELKNFYEIYPEKFNNKTNGITQRRWLKLANPKLAELITEAIGDKWITDLDELERLLPFADDAAFRDRFMKIKRANKQALADYLRFKQDIVLNVDSIFDIQVKRLHEYKRQLLNVLQILNMYNKLRVDPSVNFEPRTFIFGAKASANYRRAKLIIKLINSVADLINNDKMTGGRISVHFVKNYCVSHAEKLIPAADVSEQISTAGKEASGTGNMKFMLNGALTVGTLDGANVEILEEVGNENIFIFGLRADEVHKMAVENSYSPWDVCNMDHDLRAVLTHLIDGTLSKSNPDLFREIYDALLNGYGGSRADEYFVLKDFAGYCAAQKQVNDRYQDAQAWTRSAIVNVAKAGKFSSDRTVRQYAGEIWGLKPVEI